MRIFPGEVFMTENYDQFTKSFKRHMFVCVYVSALDKETSENRVVEGLIITSKSDDARGIVSLCKTKNEFLKHDSYCRVNGIYSFNTSINDIKILGSLDAVDFKNVISARSQVIQDERDQCLTSLVNMTKYQTSNRRI